MRRHACALLVLVACDRGGEDAGGAARAAARGPRPFPVEVEKITTRDVEYTISAVGSVEAFEQIQVTARVTGVVDQVLFTEGETVKAGQNLVEIEPRRFQLAVQSAAAAHERARATQADAEAGVARREAATRGNPGLIPGEEIETWRTRVSTARAEVAAARAALDRARLDLRDAYVRAPVAGVLESRTVQTGQYAQPGTVLATLVQRDPLMLRFDVPERDAAGLKSDMQVSFTGTEGEAARTAHIKLVPTAADAQTRMIRVTAQVDPAPGDASALRAGSFARVTIQLGAPLRAVVIPQQAVRPSEKGFLAYVVVDGKAEERVIDVGMRTADGLVEVRKGLATGEMLVVRGAEALRAGSPVLVSGSGAPPGPARPPRGAR